MFRTREMVIKGYIALETLKQEFEFEIDEDAADEEIEEEAKEEAFNFINWGWEKA